MEVNTTTTTDPVNYYNKFNNFVINPIVLIIIILIIVAYFAFSSSLGNSDSGGFSSITGDDNGGGQIMGIIIIVVLVILIIINAVQYFFSISVTAYLTDLFTNKPKIDIVVDQNTNPSGSSGYISPAPVPEIKFKKQVFNIPGNYYNYTNAKALCQAYGANLATYQQVEDAYKNSGEWCNYGWSDGQMALFPTQQTTFDNLQKIKGHENDCGRPGINGGYMANPNLRFGVNCYGNKPKITDEEEELMKYTTPYPETAEDIAFQKRVDYWKTKVEQILVSPFNYNTWS
jgi:hypothetical protein